MSRECSPAHNLVPFVPRGASPRTAAEALPELTEAPALPPTGLARERALLDTWREAHFALRLRLEDVARRSGAADLEELYDRARRADNLLAEYYQARAEVLERQLREAAGASAEAVVRPHGRAVPCSRLTERALIARFRAMSGADRLAILRLATDWAARAELPQSRAQR